MVRVIGLLQGLSSRVSSAHDGGFTAGTGHRIVSLCHVLLRLLLYDAFCCTRILLYGVPCALPALPSLCACDGCVRVGIPTPLRRGGSLSFRTSLMGSMGSRAPWASWPCGLYNETVLSYGAGGHQRVVYVSLRTPCAGTPWAMRLLRRAWHTGPHVDVVTRADTRGSSHRGAKRLWLPTLCPARLWPVTLR
jgi:hypothetical protein